MRLVSVRVKNFRCIDDSGEFAVDDLTCLVGKNESGKTALLQAIEKINPRQDKQRSFNTNRDYPRKSLSDFNEDSEVVISKWELTASEVEELERISGPNSIKSNACVLTVTYAGRDWTLDWDEKITMK